MKKIIFPADKRFVSLYEKAEQIKRKILEKLSEHIGYAPEWCEKHFEECFKKLKPNIQKKIGKLIRKANATKEYVWAGFYYKNINKIPEHMLPPTYNKKTQTIEFQEPTILKKLIKNITKVVKKLKRNKRK